MKIPKNTGIILFGYNRPSHLMRTLISLEDYKIKHVNFFLDGPRNDKDVILQKEITTIIKNTKFQKTFLYIKLFQLMIQRYIQSIKKIKK